MAGIGPGTNWFSLSGRELLVLLAGVSLVLLAVAAVTAAGYLDSRSPVEVEGAGDVLPNPARIDVNTAGEDELTMLPGIGPKTAAAIIDYRAAHGPFATFEDLRNVKGLGPATLEDIRPHAMCAPVPSDPD